MTKRERKLSRTVVDFANVESTDEACFTHFENMRDLMSFPDDFGYGVRGVFLI